MPRGFSGRVFDKSALRTWDLLSPSSIWFTQCRFGATLPKAVFTFNV